MLRARQVLGDAKTAAAKLGVTKAPTEWRIYWMATIVLLRAVWHVLDGIDKRTPGLKASINAFGQGLLESRPEPAIYWSFICDNRNAIVKRYEYEVNPAPATLTTETGAILTTEEGNPLITNQDFFHITSGPFKARDGRELVVEAIEWRDQQLTEIEAAITGPERNS